MSPPKCRQACPRCPPPRTCSLYTSSDAGASWHKVMIGYRVYVTGMMAWDSHVLVFGQGSILRSTDHGSTWQQVVPQGWNSNYYSADRCTGGQLIPGDGTSGRSPPLIYAWCYASGRSRLLKVGV